MYFSVRPLEGKYLDLLDLACNPETPPELIHQRMMELDDDLFYVGDKIADLVSELTVTAAALDEEIKRLQARKRTAENNIKWIKVDLEELMRIAKMPKFKTQLQSFNIQRNAPALKLKEGITWRDIPEEYLKHKDPEIDTAKIKEDLKYGVALDFAEMVSSESLRIR